MYGYFGGGLNFCMGYGIGFKFLPAFGVFNINDYLTLIPFCNIIVYAGLYYTWGGG